MVKAKVGKSLTQMLLQFIRDATQDLHIVAIYRGVKEIRVGRKFSSELQIFLFTALLKKHTWK